MYNAAVQPDGKTIIAGFFTSVLGVPRGNIARLNADGSLDTGFNPNVDNGVYCVAIQTDGKVLLGGPFTTFKEVSLPCDAITINKAMPKALSLSNGHGRHYHPL